LPQSCQFVDGKVLAPTVFAPTDDAFAKLPAGTVDALLRTFQNWTKILTYHVVSGKVMAADVVKLNYHS